MKPKGLFAFLLAAIIIAAAVIVPKAGLPLRGAGDGETVWQRSLGGNDDIFNSVITVSDGIVAVGFAEGTSFGKGDWAGVPGNGSDEGIIVKYDADGNLVWKKSFGGAGSDVFVDITAVPGGMVAVGPAHDISFGNGDLAGVPGKGGEFITIAVKFDDNGDVAWVKSLGGNAMNFVGSVTAVPDGVVAVGNAHSGSFGNGDFAGVPGKGDTDAFIVKYDLDGNMEWVRSFGGAAFDCLTSAVTVPGGVIAVGMSDEGSFGNGDWSGVPAKSDCDAIIVMFDGDGDVVWKKNFGGASSFNSAAAVSDGVVAVGNSCEFGSGEWEGAEEKGGGGDGDAIAVKYDFEGNVIWKRNYGGDVYDVLNNIIAVDGGFFAIAYTDGMNGDWDGLDGEDGNILVKLDNGGNIVYKKNLGGYISGLTGTEDGVVTVGCDAAAVIAKHYFKEEVTAPSPTVSPTFAPTAAPTTAPTVAPTVPPTVEPTPPLPQRELLIYAIYGGEKLLDVVTFTVDENETVELDILPENADTVKTMRWSGTGEMIPLHGAIASNLIE